MRNRYLRTSEVANRLGISSKTVRNKIAAGFFCEGEHFFRCKGFGLLWVWEAVVATIEGEALCDADGDVIRLARSSRG